MIQEAASQFWKMIPALACNLEPKFTIGWLDEFKKRYKLKKYKQYGEAGFADIADLEETIIKLWKLMNKYDMKNFYNINKAALF